MAVSIANLSRSLWHFLLEYNEEVEESALRMVAYMAVCSVIVAFGKVDCTQFCRLLGNNIQTPYFHNFLLQLNFFPLLLFHFKEFHMVFSWLEWQDVWRIFMNEMKHRCESVRNTGRRWEGRAAVLVCYPIRWPLCMVFWVQRCRRYVCWNCINSV